jgi:hypothetical protein
MLEQGEKESVCEQGAKESVGQQGKRVNILKQVAQESYNRAEQYIF